ncbi:MAG: TonB-dependent vitamin B12 receptor [Sedimenticola sp.]
MQSQAPWLTIAMLSALSTSSLAGDPEILNPVIVTASRTAETADQTLSSVTIIDREEIERRQASDITELLGGLTGINIAANGGDGKNKSIYLRGTNSSHTLLLIDGIRVGSATLGNPAWALIPLNDIERIEIVRGPRSSLYGSDAIGGVIQIFTRKRDTERRITLEAGTGSHNKKELGAGISDGNTTTSYRLSFSGERTDGYDTHEDTETDDDGFKRVSLNAGFSHELSDALELSGQLLHSQGENEFDGSSYNGNTSDFIQQNVGITLDAKINAFWESTLRLGQSLDESDAFYNGTFISRFDTRRDQLSWENNVYLGDNGLLTAGFDYLNDQVSSSNAYSVTARDNKAIFAQYRHYGEQGDFQLGLRSDDNQQFGKHTTGNIALGADLGESLRLTASAGTAFKAPTFNDLYWPATAWSSGNPNLQPEKARSYEVGLENTSQQTHWSVRAYLSKIENLIDWACTANCNDSNPWDDFWQPSNVGNARIEGIELQLDTSLYGWNSRITLNLLDPIDESTGKILLKRAKRNLRLDLDRDFGRWSLGGTLEGESGRWNNPANTVRLGGYATLDLRASYRLNPEWLVRGTIDNLFDRDYETSDGYPMPGREYFVSVIYQPE